jgi:hypothetical protein
LNRRLVRGPRVSADLEWSELARIHWQAIERHRHQLHTEIPGLANFLSRPWARLDSTVRPDCYCFVLKQAFLLYSRDVLTAEADRLLQQALTGEPLVRTAADARLDTLASRALNAAFEAARYSRTRFGQTPYRELGGWREFKKECAALRLQFELESGRHITLAQAYAAARVSPATGKRIRERLAFHAGGVHLEGSISGSAERASV